MSMRLTLVSHGTVLGHTGAALPAHGLPDDAAVWHLVPTDAFDVVEPIIAELTAPPALTLVEEVIPTQDAYLHAGSHQHEKQMQRLMREAARVHHFRLVLERYEGLELELYDEAGQRLPTATIVVTKQMVPSETLRAFVEAADPGEAELVDRVAPTYLLMARVARAKAASAA